MTRRHDTHKHNLSHILSIEWWSKIYSSWLMDVMWCNLNARSAHQSLMHNICMCMSLTLILDLASARLPPIYNTKRCIGTSVMRRYNDASFPIDLRASFTFDTYIHHVYMILFLSTKRKLWANFKYKYRLFEKYFYFFRERHPSLYLNIKNMAKKERRFIVIGSLSFQYKYAIIIATSEGISNYLNSRLYTQARVICVIVFPEGKMLIAFQFQICIDRSEKCAHHRRFYFRSAL